MVTTYSDNLRLAIQGLGDNANTWGDIANNGVFERLEDAIAGIVSLNLTGTGDYTLSVANGSYDEARNMILRLGGTPGAARNVIIPAASKLYVVECTVSASVSITIKATGGAGVSCQPGQKMMIYCDGLNTYSLSFDFAALGITASANEINILDGATLSTAELNILDGALLSTSELNILDGATLSTSELNVLDGITATTAELNVLDGITATTSELNILDGATLSTTELNVLDGITATVGELNILDGVSITAGNLNALQGVNLGMLPVGLAMYSQTTAFVDRYVNLGVVATVRRFNINGLETDYHITFTSAFSSAYAYGVLITGTGGEAYWGVGVQSTTSVQIMKRGNEDTVGGSSRMRFTAAIFKAG